MSTRGTPLGGRNRKFNKTFTGCWTCRARKVKCDETRPKCSQCSLKGFTCEGYGVRLQWMTLETGNGIPGASHSRAPRGMYHRSRVAQGPALPVLQFHEIDEIISDLESPRPGKLSTFSDTYDRFIQCFGVFNSKVGQAGLYRPARQPSESADSSPSPSSSPDAGTLQSVEPFGLVESGTGDDVPSISSFPSQPLDGDGGFFDLPLTLDSYGSNFPSQAPELTAPIHMQLVQDSEGLGSFPWADTSSKSIPPSVPPQGLSSRERFLLHHYTTEVVNLFGVCENPRSPWKKIHLPRALQSAGELVVQGSTSEIRDALRNALLSISAFVLSNKYKTQSRHQEAQKWAQSATCFRGETIMHLKHVVDSGFSRNSRPKYKECLATMLSMVSINVMSGDMEGCGMHLDAAYGLIRQARSWKTKYSIKAHALHRIYFYLRTIYQSTVVKKTDDVAQAMSHLGSSASVISGIAPMENTSPPSPQSPLSGSGELFTYETIYGIPYSLLVLLNKVVALVNRVVEEREQSGTRALPSHLIEQFDALEASIMEWQPAAAADIGAQTNRASTNSDIIGHMTRAFHNAIIIYFAQHVHLLGHHYLKPFVVKVIESLEDIERIKAEAKILAAPLYWPAFIAASEAFDQALQQRFRSWYNQVEFYGIEGVRTGICVLLGVWDQGPCTGTAITSIWRMVVQRTGVELLLG